MILCLHVPATPVVFGRAWRRDLDHVYRVSIKSIKHNRNQCSKKNDLQSAIKNTTSSQHNLEQRHCTLYKIETKGYNKKDKTVICDNYLTPKIQENVNFKKDDIIIPAETLAYIIETYTEEEKGVRNLKRCIEIIYTKLNLYRLMKPETNLFEQDLSLKVEFPFTVTVDVVKKLIKKDEKMSWGHMYL